MDFVYQQLHNFIDAVFKTAQLEIDYKIRKINCRNKA